MRSEQQAVPVAQEVEPLSLRLAVAEVASCSCDTKTDDPRYHEGRCLYRVLRDARAEIERLSLPCKSGEGAEAIDGLTRRVAEVVNEDGGCWTACSGCQESDEGYVSEKYYPYSPIFRCQPGGGCSECGGIGVLWQDGTFLASYGEALSEDTTRDATAIVAIGQTASAAIDIFDARIVGDAKAYVESMAIVSADPVAALAALNARGQA